MHSLFSHLHWWGWLIIISLAVYTLFNRRRILLFLGNLVVPHQIKEHWSTLARADAVSSATKQMGKTISEKVTANLTHQLPEVLSKDLTDKVRADVLKLLPSMLSDKLVDRVLAKLPEAMEQRATKTISNLTAQVKNLRGQINGDDSWVSIGVHVRGFKVTEEDNRDYFALIDFNTRTGQLRAEQNPNHRVIMSKDALGFTESPFDFYHDNKHFKDDYHLGAPWFSRAQGDPRTIVMCGEAYTLSR